MFEMRCGDPWRWRWVGAAAWRWRWVGGAASAGAAAATGPSGRDPGDRDDISL